MCCIGELHDFILYSCRYFELVKHFEDRHGVVMFGSLVTARARGRICCHPGTDEIWVTMWRK